MIKKHAETSEIVSETKNANEEYRKRKRILERGRTTRIGEDRKRFTTKYAYVRHAA